MTSHANLTHVRGHQLLAVIDAGHRDLPLANEWVVEGVGGDEESLWMEDDVSVKSDLIHRARFNIYGDLPDVTYQLRFLVGHDLVENMVTPLCGQLKRYSGFFQ